MRYFFTCAVLGIGMSCATSADIMNAADPLRPTQQTAVEEVDRRADELKSVNQAIWRFAEVGLQEHQSSQLLIEKLKAAGFEVESGIAGMPTAFVASYGSGAPVIGMLAEYDALPGMSQKTAPQREAYEPGAAGHACGHSGLGTGSLGAALAVKAAMAQHQLPGTIRLYGTPAEETVIGKVYMTLAGQFDDLDVCLHWHPGTRNEALASSSKALVSAKFTFFGTPAHASVSPDSGRSALDAVELMNVGVNFMREHLKEDARMHYVIVDGGGAPNVVPPQATVWYFCRADRHQDVEYNFRWLKEIAQGAAAMTRTKISIQIDTDCHWITAAEVLPGNRGVVHHSIVFVRPPDGSRFRGTGWVAAYVPGQQSTAFPEGAAIKIPAGSKLVFQQHYTPVGSVQEDITKVGLIFGDDADITHEIYTIIAI